MKPHCLPLIGLTALALCGCASGEPDTNPISEGEAAALDEAAKMLDDKRLPEDATQDLQPPATQPTDTAPD